MAQATHLNTLSRRALLGAAAAMAIPAAPALADAASSIDWASFEKALEASNEEVERLDILVAQAESAMKKWKARNPFPEEPEYSSHDECSADFLALQRRRAKWTDRYQSALRNSRVGALKTERLAAERSLEALTIEVASIECHSIADLKRKARVAMHETVGGPISVCIVIALAQM